MLPNFLSITNIKPGGSGGKARPSHGNMKLTARRQGGAKTLPHTVVSRLVWAPSGGGKHARASRYLFAALTFAWGKMTRVYEIAF